MIFFFQCRIEIRLYSDFKTIKGFELFWLFKFKILIFGKSIYIHSHVDFGLLLLEIKLNLIKSYFNILFI